METEHCATIKRANIRKITGLNPPAEVAWPFLEQVEVVVHNHNSILRNDNSHHNMGHCSRLYNRHNRNSRNHNL